MESGGDFNSSGPVRPVGGIVVVARGDERLPAREGDIPKLERLLACVASLGAGGCDEVYIALGARVVPAPDTTSTMLYLPDWYDSLDACAAAALDFADQHSSWGGAVFQTLDSPDAGSIAVSRVIEAADGCPDSLCRASYAGRPAQPFYLGAHRIREAIAEMGAGLPAFRYLIEHRDDVVLVDCTDLGNPADSLL
ncbi:hypothetical protein [Gordonia neofelifaecis]|uniref:MobA-like NTP transferase domain-containing protein n=1 Tax=Gordonia neofelifaecis NRRL B-59395 TaxID=644548 RepID=F1YF73_9ACTN|nr:hypothetical protein [Gordonia neofelifaecis]EGD56612.1 hypothetical protein SCNU_03637 [Gordonia neofelifaecis NRRL B-59395]